MQLWGFSSKVLGFGFCSYGGQEGGDWFPVRPPFCSTTRSNRRSINILVVACQLVSRKGIDEGIGCLITTITTLQASEESKQMNALERLAHHVHRIREDTALYRGYWLDLASRMRLSLYFCTAVLSCLAYALQLTRRCEGVVRASHIVQELIEFATNNHAEATQQQGQCRPTSSGAHLAPPANKSVLSVAPDESRLALRFS